MEKYKSEKYPFPSYEELCMGEAGSANDCTGFIPSGIYYGSEYESYRELCSFSPFEGGTE